MNVNEGGNPALNRSGLLLLAACNVVVGSGAMVVTGLLTGIAQDLNVSAATAGQLLTAYALAFAIGAPLVAVLAARVCRKRLLVYALLACAAMMLVGAAAPDYAVLWVARALGGVSAAVFVPNATAVAGALSAPERRGRAVAIVFGGFTLALVLGAPLGTWVGQQWGWRVPLGALGLAAWVAAAVLRQRLPGGIVLPGATVQSMRLVLRQGALSGAIGINALAAVGTFTLFSYAAVSFPALLRAGPEVVATALAVFGLGNLLGNGVSAWAVDRYGPARVASAGLAAMAGSLAVLATAWQPVAAWLALVVWGMTSFVTTTAQQARLVSVPPAWVPAALPLNSSAQFTGQALGAFVGGVWLSHAAPAPSVASGLAWLAFAMVALAAALSAWLPGPGRVSGASQSTSG